MWFGPNCLGKNTPSVRIYYMIKNMPKYLSHHAFIIVKMYVVNRIIWTWPPVVVMFTCCFILCPCLRNMWWFVTHRHPSKQCPVCLSTNRLLTAGYATHVWNYIMSSCRKIHNPYKFEEAFNLVSKGVSCEWISRIIYMYIYIVGSITYMWAFLNFMRLVVEYYFGTLA